MATLIEAKNLQKYFENFRAVNDLSFEVEAGQIYGLLGANGAGKTTTLRMLAGILQPTSGEAFITNFSMSKDPVKARERLGFLTGEMDLYKKLRPKEILHYFGELYGVTEDKLLARVEELVQLFQIENFTDRYCEKLSTGQKQRVSIARTLVHNPDVIILDEPTTGLDIVSSEFILQFIQKMAKEENKAVIFSTHNLSEVERLCDRIGIIHQGNMIMQGTLPEILEQTQETDLATAFFKLLNQLSYENQYS